MSRRRRRIGISIGRTQDPGKDLFAYLFLLIMVFSFMLLMTTEEKRGSVAKHDAPQRAQDPGRSALAVVSEKKIGRLEKKDGVLLLVFGETRYHPRDDVERMETDRRISLINDRGGNRKKMLYLESGKDNDVLLGEYLNAFQYLSRRGIGVAFAERLR